MKTSNILCIALLTMTLLFVAGSNLVLKAEFEKIDRSDEFYGYKKETLTPFHYVKIDGQQVGITQIQPGQNFEIRYNTERNLLDWKINGDTLELKHKRTYDESLERYDNFNSKPVAYIISPDLSGLESVQNTCVIANWKNTDLSIKQNGHNILLTRNMLNNLHAVLSEGSGLKIEKTNSIGSSDFKLADSSFLNAEKDVFKSFSLQADSLAKIKIPGNLFNKLTKM